MTWGPWEYNEELQILVHKDRQWYEVDLERMHDSAAVLDWIFQIHGKMWASHEDMGYLLDALRDTINPQGTICSFGMNCRREPRKV